MQPTTPETHESEEQWCVEWGLYIIRWHFESHKL